MSLLIRGATVVRALHPAVVETADIHVAGDRIAAIGAGLAVDAPVLDAGGCTVMPGNVNAHAHVYARCLAHAYHLAPPRPSSRSAPHWWRLDRAPDADDSRLGPAWRPGRRSSAGGDELVVHHASPTAIDGRWTCWPRPSKRSACGPCGLRGHRPRRRDRAADGLEENRVPAPMRHEPLYRGPWMVGAALVLPL